MLSAIDSYGRDPSIVFRRSSDVVNSVDRSRRPLAIVISLSFTLGHKLRLTVRAVPYHTIYIDAPVLKLLTLEKV